MPSPLGVPSLGRVPARLDVLTTGYVGDRVAGTVSLVRDGASVIVIDPGMVADHRDILDPMRELGVDPAAVTDVVLSHHHPDHTLNVALFPPVRVHDQWAIYEGDSWTSREAEGAQVSPSVRLLATPGHTAEDITTLVETEGGLVACTHLWWSADGPDEDPLAEDATALAEGRRRVLDLRPVLIVPGHGAPFAPGA